MREIHLYLSHDLSLPSSPIAGALPEIRARLTDNLSELLFLDELDSPVPGTIKFRRHLKAKWDGRAKRFVPLDQPTWVWEGTVLIVVPAAEVVDKIAHGDGILGTWLADNRLTLGLSEGDQVIVIVKGLQKYYAKTKTLANREFTAAARAGIDGLQGGGSAAAALSSRPAKEVIERELVKLQVEQGRFLVHGMASLLVAPTAIDHVAQWRRRKTLKIGFVTSQQTSPSVQ